MTRQYRLADRSAFARRCAAWWLIQADHWRDVDDELEQSCRENVAYWERRVES